MLNTGVAAATLNNDNGVLNVEPAKLSVLYKNLNPLVCDDLKVMLLGIVADGPFNPVLLLPYIPLISNPTQREVLGMP